VVPCILLHVAILTTPFLPLICSFCRSSCDVWQIFLLVFGWRQLFVFPAMASTKDRIQQTLRDIEAVRDQITNLRGDPDGESVSTCSIFLATVCLLVVVYGVKREAVVWLAFLPVNAV